MLIAKHALDSTVQYIVEDSESKEELGIVNVQFLGHKQVFIEYIKPIKDSVDKMKRILQETLATFSDCIVSSSYGDIHEAILQNIDLINIPIAEHKDIFQGETQSLTFN